MEQVRSSFIFAGPFSYRKPPNISPGLIFVLFGGLIHGGGGAYIRGGLYTDTILC